MLISVNFQVSKWMFRVLELIFAGLFRYSVVVVVLVLVVVQQNLENANTQNYSLINRCKLIANMSCCVQLLLNTDLYLMGFVSK